MDKKAATVTPIPGQVVQLLPYKHGNRTGHLKVTIEEINGSGSDSVAGVYGNTQQLQVVETASAHATYEFTELEASESSDEERRRRRSSGVTLYTTRSGDSG